MNERLELKTELLHDIGWEEFLEDEDDENMQGKERPHLNACADLKNSQTTFHAARNLQMSGVKVCD